MNNQSLFTRQNIDPENPFNGDLFKRRELSNKLTTYLERLKDGAVLGIDAPWGDGKSWFGQNWANQLRNDDYKVIYLDAFQQDYIEDPFIMIASEIQSLIKADATLAEEFKTKAASVMKSLIPLSTKILLNAGGLALLGKADLSSHINDSIKDALESSSENVENWLENRIDEYETEKHNLKSFVDTLRAFCKSQKQPVLFFIDELDRCKPTFAVNLLERIKHFFDVPNLIFIVLTNKSQLEAAIRGVYGDQTNANDYLGKFINLYLNLPKALSYDSMNENSNWLYLHKIFQRFTIDSNEMRSVEIFVDLMARLATKYNLSLRDLEKSVALFMLNGVSKYSGLIAWPIVLKLKYPEIYKEFLSNPQSAHSKAYEILVALRSINNNGYKFEIEFFIAYHKMKSSNPNFGPITDQENQTLNDYNNVGRGVADKVLLFFKSIDLIA